MSDATNTRAGSGGGLVRTFGRWTLAGLMLNAILGAGVFGLPSLTADKLGSLAWLGVIVTGIAIGTVVLCFAEVASRFSGTGGPYLYTRTAFGPWVGLVVAWLHYLTRISAAASVANLFVIYLVEFFPLLVSWSAKAAVISLVFGILAFINVRGVKQGAIASNLLIVVKIVPLVLFAVVGFGLVLARGPVEPAVVVTPTVQAWFQAIMVLVFAFGGFESGVIALGEAKNPERDSPFALILAIVVCTCLYTLVQAVASLTLADPASHPRSVADAARVLVGPAGASFMAVGALLSMVGWFAGAMTVTPRLTYAMAEQGVLPAAFARLHPVHRTPVFSIALFAVLSVALAMSGSFLDNVTLSVISRLAIYGLVCLSLIALRRQDGRNPTLALPRFRLPGGTFFAICGIALSVTLASRMTMRETIILAIVLGLASINLFASRRRAR